MQGYCDNARPIPKKMEDRMKPVITNGQKARRGQHSARHRLTREEFLAILGILLALLGIWHIEAGFDGLIARINCIGSVAPECRVTTMPTEHPTNRHIEADAMMTIGTP